MVCHSLRVANSCVAQCTGSPPSGKESSFALVASLEATRAQCQRLERLILDLDVVAEALAGAHAPQRMSAPDLGTMLLHTVMVNHNAVFR